MITFDGRDTENNALTICFRDYVGLKMSAVKFLSYHGTSSDEVLSLWTEQCVRPSPMSFKLRLNLLHASTKSLTLINHSPPALMLGLNPDHNHDSFSTNHESRRNRRQEEKSSPNPDWERGIYSRVIRNYPIR